MASGWNLWVWLVSVVVRRYIIDILIIIITFPTRLVLALFFAAASLFLFSFLKCFFVLYNFRLYVVHVPLMHKRRYVGPAGWGSMINIMNRLP